MSRGSRIALLVVSAVASVAIAIAFPWLRRGGDFLTATWQWPWALAGLVVVPAVFWWGTVGQDARTPRLRIGTVAALVTGPRGIRTSFRDVPGVLRAAALALFIAALARPVSMLRDERSDDKGIDIVVVMDLSGSMRAVLDAHPRDLPGDPQLPRGRRPTRLDVAKVVVRDFISRRKTDRIGVVVFGKSAFVLSPPTLDYHLLSHLIGKMTLNVIDGSATAIGDALGAAVARMRRSDARSKAVVLLTDGDSNAGLISPEYATQLAKTTGCKVYPIQIGTDDEVDVEEGGTDLFGQPRYVRHRFPVNPELLKTIAIETGGEAYIATDAKALAASMHAVLDQMEKTRFEASSSSFEELFPILLVPGVALIALDALLRVWLLRRLP